MKDNWWDTIIVTKKKLGEDLIPKPYRIKLDNKRDMTFMVILK